MARVSKKEKEAPKQDLGDIDLEGLNQEQQLEALKKEHAKLLARVEKSKKYIPRETPDSYLLTMDNVVVEDLCLEKPAANGMRRPRKKGAVPFHVTGSSLHEGKRFYYDIKLKKLIVEYIGEERFSAKFTEVTDIINSEHFEMSKDLENKFAESADVQKKIASAKGEIPNEIDKEIE